LLKVGLGLTTQPEKCLVGKSEEEFQTSHRAVEPIMMMILCVPMQLRLSEQFQFVNGDITNFGKNKSLGVEPKLYQILFIGL
jgi:hypothetical protein